VTSTLRCGHRRVLCESCGGACVVPAVWCNRACARGVCLARAAFDHKHRNLQISRQWTSRCGCCTSRTATSSRRSTVSSVSTTTSECFRLSSMRSLNRSLHGETTLTACMALHKYTLSSGLPQSTRPSYTQSHPFRSCLVAIVLRARLCLCVYVCV
jgi:hypothetical protein